MKAQCPFCHFEWIFSDYDLGRRLLMSHLKNKKCIE